MRAMLLAAMVLLSAQAPKLTFDHVVIDREGPLDIWLKAAGDLNGDKRPDLIAGGAKSGGLVWYENPGWQKRVISADLSFSTDGEVYDMDRDGDLDVVAITRRQIVWFENPGWRMHAVAEIEVHDIEVADLDLDGKPEIVARNQGAFRERGGALLHFFNNTSADDWQRRTIDIPDGEGLLLADIDGDRDPDVVLERQWLENRAGTWTPHLYGPLWTHPHTFVAAGDLNGDRRLDIVLAPSEKEGGSYHISWFEAPFDPRQSPWTEHVITEPVETVHHFVGVADFNRDGRFDVATAAMQQGKSPAISIYFNHKAGRVWMRQDIARVSSHSMRILDIDGDQRPDLFGADWRGSRTVEIWRNATAR